MKMDSLIELVTKQVMEKIRAMEGKKKVLVLGSCDSSCVRDVCEVLAGWGFEFDEIDSYKSSRSVDTYDFIVMPYLEISQLSCIVLGLGCDDASRALIDGIMKGKKVYIIDENIEYKGFRDVCNPSFYSMFEEYEKKLAGYGVNIVKKDQLACCMENRETVDVSYEVKKEDDSSCSETVESPEPRTYVVSKRILTEADVYKIARDGYKEISAPKKTIVTPSAYDCMKIHNIRFFMQ